MDFLLPNIRVCMSWQAMKILSKPKWQSCGHKLGYYFHVLLTRRQVSYMKHIPLWYDD